MRERVAIWHMLEDFKKNYLFIFRERGGRKKERERNIDRLSLVHIPTRTEPAMCPYWESNP